jgi:hypothetical protein
MNMPSAWKIEPSSGSIGAESGLDLRVPLGADRVAAAAPGPSSSSSRTSPFRRTSSALHAPARTVQKPGATLLEGSDEEVVVVIR